MKGLAVLLGGYLLGSVSFSYLVVKRTRGRDVRKAGSGSAGATNVMRVAGLGPALTALALDAGKGAAAVSAARAVEVSDPWVGGTAVAVVLGHLYPLFLGFRGGKGVATSTGALAVLAPLPTGLAFLVFVGTVSWKRFVSLGSVAAAASFPLWVGVCGRLGWGPRPARWLVATATALAGLIVGKHAANLRRLREGREPRLGERAGNGAAEAR